MKKAKLFFMTLIAAVILMGGSETSYAFDFSKIVTKPVSFVKYVAKKAAFWNDEDEPGTDPEKQAGNNGLSEGQDSSDDMGTIEALFARSTFSDLLIESSVETLPLYQMGPNLLNGWQKANENFSLNYTGESWFFEFSSKISDSSDPFDIDKSSSMLTNMEYGIDLSSEFISRLDLQFLMESTITQRYSLDIRLRSPFYVFSDEPVSSEPSGSAYALGVSASINDALVSLYAWYSDQNNTSNQAYPGWGIFDEYSDLLWRAGNSESYNNGSDNITAAISYNLPVMKIINQETENAIRLETAYRFASNDPDSAGITDNYDRFKVGLSYKGHNRAGWLNPYGLNWGVGYNYNVKLDGLDTPGEYDQKYTSHSGNINANTYWFDMKLYTMFMYLYDRQTKDSMTVLNAIYSPDWQWSYGIRANFYYGKKDENADSADNKDEFVSFTATYRWD